MKGKGVGVGVRTAPDGDGELFGVDVVDISTEVLC